MENGTNYNFICDNELKEKTIREFHRAILQGLIDKYGIETMQEVQNRIDLLNEKIGEQS